jgi:hypothetical protein
VGSARRESNTFGCDSTSLSQSDDTLRKHERQALYVALSWMLEKLTEEMAVGVE